MTVGNNQRGILMFMRGESGIDKDRYRIYRDEVLLPFLSKSREEFGGWVKGTPIPQELKAVSWSDGDLAQIDNIVNEDSLHLYEQNLLCASKQNPARTGTEQQADITKVFKIMPALQKTITVSDIPIDLHPMKRLVSREIQKWTDQNRLKLKLTKKNAIIDFVSSVPEMTAKAVTRPNITHGSL